MNKATFISSFALTIIIGLYFSSCSSQKKDGTIVFTRTASGKESNYNLNDGNKSQCQIVSIDPAQPEKSLKVLTSGFFSATSLSISYDGNNMLFSGKAKESDSWQIWEMNISTLKSRQITNSSGDCTDPVYLPNGRLVFSQYSKNDSLKAGYSLFTCALDGSALKRITFNPHTFLSNNVLNDGRVLTAGKQVFPNDGPVMYIVMRPDGTKAELFYKASEGTKITGPACETIDGKLAFIEYEGKNSKNGSLVTISYNRPLHSRTVLTSGIDGDFRSVFAQKSGKYLVSYRKVENEKYSIFEFDPATKTLGKEIYSDSKYDVIAAVEADQHEKPRKLPSEVDMGVKTGLLMCQDVNIFDQSAAGTTKAFGIEIIGIDSTLGAIQVEEDGSFYMKVLADKPFRIQTTDKDGKVLDNACGWIYLRPNERRGCVGCHENPEIVPGNHIPLAVKKSPVIVPNHINKVVEKKVSLE